MDQQHSSEETPLFAGRYEWLPAEADDAPVQVIDRKPWLHCWACGSTANESGELFCTDCGASLDGRRYQGQLTSGETGLVLVTEVQDEAAREILPQIWDQVQDDGQTLTLAVENMRAPLTLPLEELAALRVGRELAALLSVLHAQGLALGEIAQSDLELTPDGKPHLRQVPNLHHAEPQDAAADLRKLASLLESLTSTPRTTQRLSETQASDTTASLPALPDILRTLRTGEIAKATDLTALFDTVIAERTEKTALWARVGAASHAGMIRPLDEDSLLALDLRRVQNSQGRSWGLYIVADGMGGHAAGEVASGLAIRGAAESVLRSYFAPTIELDSPDDEEQLIEVVHRAIEQANDYVVRESQARGNDMGTTITMALVAGDRAIVGNVGDSRTYLLRGGSLRRISKDHSLVMRLVELGQITDDEIYTHPQRNAVLRSLGDRGEVEIDTFSLKLRPGDALFLCCDGQWEMTRDPQMAEIISLYDDPQQACEALIVAANRAGGDDNITAILVKFEEYHEPEPAV